MGAQEPLAEHRRDRRSWWAAIGRVRSVLLLAVPVLLALFCAAGANMAHFGWGFGPSLALLPILAVVWLYVLVEGLASGLSLVGRRGAARSPDERSRQKAILRFDLVLIACFLLALLTAVACD